jgi:ribose 5-phosphate isomerase A
VNNFSFSEHRIMKNNDNAKRAAGVAAANLIQDGMQVGLGTGSTAFFFIEHLIQRCKEGLKIHGIASSIASHELALKGKIPLLDMESIDHLDVTVDGADEIDTHKRMIKGGGGAHVREKILACMSHEMIVVVDETKCVERLGKRPLPVEIIPFAWHATERHLNALGYRGKWRSASHGKMFLTDNGNFIYDIYFDSLLVDPETDNEKILGIPGVVDTGFFLGIAGRVIIGYADGRTQTQ